MKKNGFTLIEILLYVSIVSLIMTALIPFTINIITTNNKRRTQQELSSNLRWVGERLKTEIRNSNGFITGSSNFDINLANNSSAQLALIQDPPNNPLIINVAGGRIRLKYGASPAIDLNSIDTTVTNLTFFNYSSTDNKSKNIAFTITMSVNYLGSRQEFTQTATIQDDAEIRSN